MNILFLDLETTGLNKDENEVIQLAALVVVNGEIKEELSFFFKPEHPENTYQKALEITGLTMETIMAYNDDPRVALRTIDQTLKKWAPINEDWAIAGQNVKFDMEFFELWWNKNQGAGSKLYRKTFKFVSLDLINLAFAFHIAGVFTFKNFKLSTILETLDMVFEGESHNALNDIRMTYKAYFKLIEMIINK